MNLVSIDKVVKFELATGGIIKKLATQSLDFCFNNMYHSNMNLYPNFKEYEKHLGILKRHKALCHANQKIHLCQSYCISRDNYVSFYYDYKIALDFLQNCQKYKNQIYQYLDVIPF